MGHFLQICNNQECLFDGFDCDSAQEQCQKSDYCTGHYGNENCDPECNVIGCGWDGGDCDSADTHSSLAGNIIVILLISPEEFVRNAQTFLFTLSQKLRGSVRIRTMNGKPMIYSWSSEKGVGAQYDVPAEQLQSLVLHHRRERRQSKINFFANKSEGTVENSMKLRGTMVMLTLDVSRCQASDHEECFTDVFSVVDYLGASNAKQVIFAALLLVIEF
ncbi:unnamed protein product [Gongylonema pulchrum]|uniref:LNR domain-containing protein n=1 Tax=Gongylonema pulchrum TaxID=637853 RepID=A0A183EWN8_9BILA|nr:unnamed protein product [Gongylonema pulchrum]